jgi:sugar phosphate permease
LFCFISKQQQQDDLDEGKDKPVVVRYYGDAKKEAINKWQIIQSLIVQNLLIYSMTMKNNLVYLTSKTVSKSKWRKFVLMYCKHLCLRICFCKIKMLVDHI